MAYDVERLQAPRIAGLALRGLAALVENPLTGAPLRRLMLKSIGIPRFRAIPACEAAVVATPLPGLERSCPASTAEPAASPAALQSGEPARGLAAAAALPPAPPQGFAFTSAAQLTEAYRAGRLTPSEIAERALAAIAASEERCPPLRVFIACDPEDVRAQARAATERWRAGTPRGPLDGVPVAIKDEVDLVPYPTTAGTRFFGRRPAARDATSVARLRAAGAVLLGKANMHEIGLGVTGLNPHHGTARNPCDPTRITGGSSSGSAAAVAAGFCPLALGCDGGGSIRIPAALCGVFGLKPTFGRVSEHGAAPICWSVAHIGPIAATARDLALGYLAMAGEDPLDPNTLGQPAPHLQGVGEGGLQGLRLGIYRPWFEDADAEVVARCRELLLALERAGAELRDVEIPELGMVRPVHAVTIALEMASSFALAYRQDRSRFGLDVRLLLALAYACEPTDYVHAQRLRRRICGRFQAALGEVDAIVTPSTAGVAPPVPEDALATGESNFETLDRLTRFMTAANLTGLPAITIPAGHAEGGMPVGLQAIGRAWQEHVLLRLAYAAEPAVERRRPAVHWPLLGEPAGS